jgi:hypothetical protein
VLFRLGFTAVAMAGVVWLLVVLPTHVVNAADWWPVRE